ncbi:MAG: YgjV family protein, partial [Clostridia bacterium]|nr:YgjV family protein [Clostridia bacterium]
LLAMQTIATSFICVQYLLIGAYSGFALNIVCIIRNLCLYFRDKHNKTGIALPFVLAFLMMIMSVFSWEGPVSLFIMAGLVINTVCMGVLNTQNLRKSIILTSSLIILYNVVVGSYAGIVNEGISIASAVIGVLRFAKKK